jgi:3',5'-cyclic AMP phosphodiesterase CpdA
MMKHHKIILRFSDYEVATIPTHQEIIKTGQPVWWGWWKKKHEPMQSEALAEIAKRCPLQIGLVNRMAQEFYSARCTKVIFNPDGSDRPSPEPQCTPNYYRDSLHPAWFEFSSIETLSRKSFVREFGENWRSDSTFFVVEETGSGIPVSQGVPIPDFVKTNGDSILHLSDLHFGDDHGFPIAQLEEPVHELTLASIISERIRSLPDCRIGVVIVSGDITTKGDANGNVDANVFFRLLFKLLGIGAEHAVIVPGNHDIWLRDEHPTWDYHHEEPFRQFLTVAYGSKVSEIERLYVFRTPGGWTLSIVGLNSARPRRKETMDYGYVGSDRYEPLLRCIDKSNDGKSLTELAHAKRLNFAVLHHHLLPARLVCKPEDSRPVSLTLDAGQLVEDFQASGIHFALHGHQHVPFVGSTARARRAQNKWTGYEQQLFVIGSGSSGVRAERLEGEMRNNTFGIYTPRENGLHVRMEEFTQSFEPRTFMELLIPFR